MQVVVVLVDWFLVVVLWFDVVIVVGCFVGLDYVLVDVCYVCVIYFMKRGIFLRGIVFGIFGIVVLQCCVYSVCVIFCCCVQFLMQFIFGCLMLSELINFLYLLLLGFCFLFFVLCSGGVLWVNWWLLVLYRQYYLQKLQLNGSLLYCMMKYGVLLWFCMQVRLMVVQLFIFLGVVMVWCVLFFLIFSVVSWEVFVFWVGWVVRCRWVFW